MVQRNKELEDFLRGIFKQPITIKDKNTLELFKQGLPPYTRIRTYKEMELERALVYIHIPSLLKDLEDKGYTMTENDLYRFIHKYLKLALGKRMKDNEIFTYGYIEFLEEDYEDKF